VRGHVSVCKTLVAVNRGARRRRKIIKGFMRSVRMGKSYISVQTLTVDKIIVTCGCIWAVAIIIA